MHGGRRGPRGLVTRWRDYFDLHQIDDQIAAHPPDVTG